MPEIPDVIPGAPVESGWGNTVRDRVTQRFSDSTARDLSLPTPGTGAVVWLDTPGVLEVFDGSDWVAIPTVSTLAQYLRLDALTNVELTNGLRYSVSGQFVLVRVSTTVPTESTLDTLPVGLRPLTDLNFVGGRYNSSGVSQSDGFGTLTVRANGIVSLRTASPYTAGSDTIRGTLLFIAGGG